MKRKLLAAAYWAAPPILCFVLYWPGLLAWFQQDDFVWLNLINHAHGLDGVLRTLFQPTVQGTWRPLSERAFFLVFGAMFGSDALPYRIWVFLTMCLNLALLQAVTAKITRSRAAGFWAAIFWIANSRLATVMSWTCEYILVACGFFLLLAMYLLLRYAETGERKYYLWTWAAFLPGFLANETNIVFPLLAGSYALFCMRTRFRSTLPFFAISGIYGILHVLLAPNQGSIPYTMHFDRVMPATFWAYWQEALRCVPANLSRWVVRAGTIELVACTVALLGFAACQAWKKRWTAAVLLLWFAFLLGPVIPLRDHFMDYYLTLPLMGIAMAGAYALTYAWRAGLVWRLVGVLLTAGFLVQQAPAARHAAQWFRDRAEAQEALVMGVERIHQLHPGKTILLDGVDDTLFWGGVQQQPFQFLQIRNVYLTPGSEDRITPHPEIDDISKFILPAEETRHGLESDMVVVYSAGSGPLRNITHQYKVPAGPAGGTAPLRVDAANPLAAEHLGPTWYALEPGRRWMPGTASVRMAGPRAAGQRLYVTAYCPAGQLDKGPLSVSASIYGVREQPAQIVRSGDVTLTFPIPAAATGKADIEIVLELNHTMRVPGDSRDLGLAFGTFEIK